MRVVIAPDSFKDAITASKAVEHIAAGVRASQPEAAIDACPIADGGEGFTDAIRLACSGFAQRRTVMTVDPLGRAIESGWLLVKRDLDRRVAIVELASASGLERLADHERDPMKSSTFGSGSVILDALSEGVDELVLGIGGSATNDAGCGIAQAFGVCFFDTAGEEIDRPMTGGMLKDVTRIGTKACMTQSKSMKLSVACDVDNPLTGRNGAAHVYAPQKGATAEQVEQLDAGLRHIAQLWREQLGIDVEQMPGAGAAGGVGGGLVAMLGAELVPGAELVLDTVGFDARIKAADLVITGEGRLDGQSLQGKAAIAVARRCKAAGVPCVALVGSIGEGADRSLEQGLAAYRVIGEGLPADESIRRTPELLEEAAAKLIRDRLC